MTDSGRYVRYFAGFPARGMEVGGETAVTAGLDGNVLVTGRPHLTAGSPPRFDPDTDLAGCERELQRLDGWFGILAIGTEKAIAATDILGTGGIFFAQTKRGSAVASSLGRIAPLLDSRSYDRSGAVAALAGSLFPDGQTPFQGVRRLQGGEYVVLDLQGNDPPTVRSYADPAQMLVGSTEEPGDPEEMMALLEAAVARENPTSDTALLLTAGKDSQAIGHALTEEDRARMTAYTYGGWRSVDRRDSRRAAREIGIRHRRVGPLRLRLRSHADLISVAGGGQTGLQVTQHLAGVDAVTRRARRILTGYPGDVLAGKAFSASWERQVQFVRLRQLVWINSSGIRLQEVFADEIEAIRSRLQARLDSHRELPPGRAGMLLDLTHRQATYIGGAFVLMHEMVDTMTPFFNRPLMRYMFSRTVDDLTDQSLYVRMMQSQRGSAASHRPSPVDRLAAAAQDRHGRYGTVNWPKVIARERDWLRARLQPFAGDDEFAALGIKSLETDSSLPFALAAIPLVEAMHGVRLSSDRAVSRLRPERVRPD